MCVRENALACDRVCGRAYAVVCVCVRARVRACVRACVRAGTCVREHGRRACMVAASSATQRKVLEEPHATACTCEHVITMIKFRRVLQS